MKQLETGQVEAGPELEVSAMNRVCAAPLRALVPAGDVISHIMKLRVALPNSLPLVGSPVRVSLPTAEPRDVLAAP